MIAPPVQPNIWQNEPVQVKRGDIFQLGTHRLMCGDSTCAEDVAQLLQEESADLVFADPPYGMGIDVWDTKIADIPSFLALSIQHLKQGGFFSFTCQMPYMLAWLNGVEQSGLKYKDHIAWIKRNATTPGAALMRSHESLFIYSKGKSNYTQTRGRYSDVKVPGLCFDMVSISGIQTYINDLHAKLRGDTTRRRRTPPDSTYTGYKGYQGTPLSSDRSDEYTNFTNVWSFLAENQHRSTRIGEKHATAKPILLLERLLELCTPENALVYDPFLGSGTTMIAAEKVGRRCVGMELSEGYCRGIIARWQSLTGRKAVQL